MPNFSTRLKELRNQANLSQQELSQIIGISKSSINMYERGEREPGLETVGALADFFHVRTDYLLGKTNKNPPSKFDLSEGEKILLDLFRRVPNDKQEIVIQMIRFALGNQE